MINKLACGVLAVLSTTAAFAGANPEFVELAVTAAHKRGFSSCDGAIRGVLEAGGQDIRVHTDNFPETKSDQIQMMVVYGSAGDAVELELNIRALGKNCFVQRQATLASSDSCQQYLRSNKALELKTTSAGVLFAKTQGGGDAVLMPSGNQCIIKYRVADKFPRG